MTTPLKTGVPPHKVIAKRRARNKAARLSRRINRQQAKR